MSLKRLYLRSFRNYKALSLDVPKGITVITGRNGIGKTTILEAICILGSGRSFRVAKNTDFIKKGEGFGVVAGQVDNQDLVSSLEVKIHPQGKRVFVDEKLAKSTDILLRFLPSIVFSPSDHNIIEGDSFERKFFLNRAASLLDWEYSSCLTAFNKALIQRNRLLKNALEQNWNQTMLFDQIEVWDNQLVQFGSQLMMMRSDYLADLRPVVENEYRKISQSSDEFQISYLPMDLDEFSPSLAETLANWALIFSQKLKDSLRRDIAVGSTQIGPHKDEILLILNGNKVKFYGSQGEKRTCALALRLGELALFRARTNRLPILLFDDVSSELDRIRRQSLVNLLRQEKAQVLITATELPSSLIKETETSFEHLDLGEQTDGRLELHSG